MPKMVSINSNRRGSVSAGPLTIKFGDNEVSEKDFAAFKKTKLGKAMVKNQTITYAVKAIEEDPAPEAEAPVFDDEGDGAVDSSEEDASAPAAPSLSLSAKEAKEFIAGLDDLDVILACHEQDERVSVRKACITRAEELSGDEAAAA